MQILRYLRKLASEEARIKAVWEKIRKNLDRDLAYVWVDETKKEFNELKDEAERVAFILKKLHGHYGANQLRYEAEISHVKSLIAHLNKADSTRKWVLEIHSDILKIISDIEGESQSLKPSIVPKKMLRRDFLKIAGRAAFASAALGALTPFTAMASSNDLYKFKKERVLAVGRGVSSNFKEIVGKIRRINFFIVKDREIKFFYLENELLEKLAENSLEVKGYITHIEIFSREPVKLLMDGSRFETFNIVKIAEEGNYLDYQIQTEDSSEFTFSGRTDRDFLIKTAEEKLYCFSIGEFPYEFFSKGFLPISSKSRIKLSIKSNKKCDLLAYQSPMQDFSRKSIESKESYDDLYFTYMGNNKIEFENLPDIDKKLYALTKGIYEVEKLFNVNLIDYCVLVDYDRLNAEYWGNRAIAIYYTAIINHTAELLKIGAEHETLHALDYSFGIHENEAFISLFDELQSECSDKKDCAIFKFINEENYLTTGGGHSLKNPTEFFASFVHTLMYLGIFESNLKILKKEDAVKILDTYKRVLKLLIAISPKKINSIFIQALHYVEKKVNI
ncbi:hypothetical protein HYX09_05560 [Candidatus Woesearchaeota archaeon]|nr:hypothetical protein [Candidatus Woesearchaeota archaeon]